MYKNFKNTFKTNHNIKNVIFSNTILHFYKANNINRYLKKYIYKKCFTRRIQFDFNEIHIKMYIYTIRINFIDIHRCIYLLINKLQINDIPFFKSNNLKTILRTCIIISNIHLCCIIWDVANILRGDIVKFISVLFFEESSKSSKLGSCLI